MDKNELKKALKELIEEGEVKIELKKILKGDILFHLTVTIDGEEICKSEAWIPMY